MNRATAQLISAILEGNVVTFRKTVDSASDSQMVDALQTLWRDHKKVLEENETALDLFLEVFNYQYNKFLIDRPQLEDAKKPVRTKARSPINASVVKDVFKLARERQVLAY